MAKLVLAQVANGVAKTIKNVDTIQELREKLELGADYTATLNGEVADDDTEIEELEAGVNHVAFAQKVKGGIA